MTSSARGFGWPSDDVAPESFCLGVAGTLWATRDGTSNSEAVSRGSFSAHHLHSGGRTGGRCVRNFIRLLAQDATDSNGQG